MVAQQAFFINISVIGELIPFKESYEVCSRAKWRHFISQKALLAAQKIHSNT
jgi:hypothetical protein